MIGLVYGYSWVFGFIMFYTKRPWKRKTAIRIRYRENLTYLDCFSEIEIIRLLEFLKNKELHPKRLINPVPGDNSKEKLFSPRNAKDIIDSPVYSAMIPGRLDPGVAKELRMNNYLVLEFGQNWLLL